MIVTTRAQRVALKRIFDRAIVWARDASHTTCDSLHHVGEPLTYIQFRRRLQSGYGCVMIHWANMWLGIEPDGYIHS